LITLNSPRPAAGASIESLRPGAARIASNVTMTRATGLRYCNQYGIGTRKNAANAKRMFRRAIGSDNITANGREAALYHLALQFVDEGKAPAGNSSIGTGRRR
jgi:hypothetical protein